MISSTKNFVLHSFFCTFAGYYMKRLSAILLCVISVIIAWAYERPRVVIMTDAETDDRCSMVHALLYANDMDIAAIIQTNSCFQRKGMEPRALAERHD